jgi:hypothetical protein
MAYHAMVFAGKTVRREPDMAFDEVLLGCRG